MKGLSEEGLMSWKFHQSAGLQIVLVEQIIEIYKFN